MVTNEPGKLPNPGLAWISNSHWSLNQEWRGWDLNPHPRAYESPAPPLSYLAKRRNDTIGFKFCQLT